MGTFISSTLERTSAVLLPPGMTELTAAWPSGNWIAAAISGTPCRAHTASMPRQRPRTSSSAGS